MKNVNTADIEKQLEQNIAAYKKHNVDSERSADLRIESTERYATKDAHFYQFDNHEVIQIGVPATDPEAPGHPVIIDIFSFSPPFESGSFDLITGFPIRLNVHHPLLRDAKMKHGNLELTVEDRQLNGRLSCEFTHEHLELRMNTAFAITKS